MLKNKATRIAAGTIGCAMAFLCAAHTTSLFVKSDEFYNSNDYTQNYGTYNEDANDIYRKLYIAGHMYLNKLDENGNFDGTEYEKKQTISVLQEMGIMDNNGELQISDSNNIEYRVNIGYSEYSNTDKSHDDLSSTLYSFRQRNGEVLYSNYFHCFYGSGLFNWFTTNYGMTYYYIEGKGYAIYDFDTTGCNSYVDELGATIYYKTDGSTPLPDDYINPEQPTINEQIPVTEANEAFTDNYEQEFESEHIEDKTDTDIQPVTDAGKPVIDESKFIKTQMPEDEIVITISPNDNIIAEIEKSIEEERKHESELNIGFLKLIPFAAIALIMAVYVLIAGGYSKKDKKFVLTSADKVFAEIYIAFATAIIGGAVAYCCYIDEIWDSFKVNYTSTLFSGINGTAGAVVFGATLLILNSLIIRFKCRSMMKTSIIGRIINKGIDLIKCLVNKAKKAKEEFLKNMVSRDMLRNDKFTRSFVLRTGIAIALGVISLIISAIINEVELFPVCAIIIVAAYIYFSFADLKAFERLNEHISAVNSGDYMIRNEELDSPIYVPTEKLNNISDGIQTTVEKQLKSERMKIELVTNVSHDLKTPLTSIISYIDLLSAEELSPTARDYVTIIEDKSQRLKTMVADLFDLAKATSRTDVQSEEIDAVVLTRQVLGDMADKIEASGRALKCDIQAETAPINADGKKMYRVLQNIIDNALKYSMEGTRIYLTLKNENGACDIIIKNIASYEMTFNPDEITERFTRGDEARSTEGNGLGLSIAKSFTEACGGQFRVDIDGDMFIAVVTIPVI
jgi:signal transduction histidine kinase